MHLPGIYSTLTTLLFGLQLSQPILSSTLETLKTRKHGAFMTTGWISSKYGGLQVQCSETQGKGASFQNSGLASIFKLSFLMESCFLMRTWGNSSLVSLVTHSWPFPHVRTYALLFWKSIISLLNCLSHQSVLSEKNKVASTYTIF